MGDCACHVFLKPVGPVSRPSYLFLELTAECNSSCQGCGNPNTRKGFPGALTLEQWSIILDRLSTYDIRLRLTGGEPTLHPEFGRIVSQIESVPLLFTVFSNARWIDPVSVISALHQTRGLECLLVSLHGTHPATHEAFTATPHSFNETVANICRATDAGLPVSSSTVITHQNHNEIEEIVEVAESIGIKRFTFSRYIGPPLPGIEPSDEELKIAIRTIDQLAHNGHSPQNGQDVVRFGAPVPRCFSNNGSTGCMAGFAHATIDSRGNLKPCSHLSITAGNLLEDDFETLWRSPVMEEWRKNLMAQCDGCPIADRCRSGCLAQAIWRGHEKDPLITWRGQTLECPA